MAKKYTVVDPEGRTVTEAGPIDAALWRRRADSPLKVERTEMCPRCGLHRCGGGRCAES